MSDAPLPCGIPTIEEHRRNLASSLFREMRGHSESFVAANREAFDRYGRRWVRDPLANWSRQWEYPFVCGRVDAHVGALGRPARLLDAGSGFTFFPWFVASRHPDSDVRCCDRDPSLAAHFDSASRAVGRRVAYDVADIRALPFEGGAFDVVSCVSVLEHTDCHAAIVAEFRRVLRPGGRLVVTFDVSLDGSRDIGIAGAEALMEAMRTEMEEDEPGRGDVAAEAGADGILTTIAARDLGLGALPWTYPAILYRAQSLVKGKGLVAWPPPVAVCCASFRKPA